MRTVFLPYHEECIASAWLSLRINHVQDISLNNSEMGDCRSGRIAEQSLIVIKTTYPLQRVGTYIIQGESPRYSKVFGALRQKCSPSSKSRFFTSGHNV